MIVKPSLNSISQIKDKILMAAGHWLLFWQNKLFQMLGIYCQVGSCQGFESCNDFDLLDPLWK